jgi:hypothetical protein
MTTFLKLLLTVLAFDEKKDALIEVAKSKGSPNLEEFVAIERTKGGVLSLSEIKNAYQLLGISEEDEVPDVLLISLFQGAVCVKVFFRDIHYSCCS